MIKSFAAVFLCFVVGAANASIVTFKYSGTIGGAAITVPGSAEWDHAVIDGHRINLGDTVEGSISYDTSTPLWHTNKYGNYFLGFGETTLTHAASGYVFHSTSLDFPQTTVSNDSIGWGAEPLDAFAMFSDSDSDPGERLTFSLFDFTATAFDNAMLPEQLDLYHFQQRDVYLDSTHGDIWSQFSVGIESLERVQDVPEPATGWLSLTGLMLLALARRRI